MYTSNSQGTHKAPPAYHHVDAVAARQLCRRLATQLALKGSAIILLLHLQLMSAVRQPARKASNQQQLQAKLCCSAHVMEMEQMLQSVWSCLSNGVLAQIPTTANHSL